MFIKFGDKTKKLIVKNSKEENDNENENKEEEEYWNKYQQFINFYIN